MTTKTRALSGQRIGFFGKGGSGKSTALVLLAKALAEKGYDVVVLDADSTNVGLYQALGLASQPVPLLEYYGGMVFMGGAVTCPVDDPTLLPGAEITLEGLPGSYYARSEKGILFLTAGKMGDKGPGAGCDGPVVKIARDVRLLGAGANPVTLVDFKAGFEDSARGAITSLDWALVVVDPTQAAMQMAVHMKEMVRSLKAGGLPATKHLERFELVELANRLFREARIEDVLFVLNKVSDEETEGYMRQRLSTAGIEPVGVIHRDAAIANAWLRGGDIDSADSMTDGRQLAEALETMVASRRQEEEDIHSRVTTQMV